MGVNHADTMRELERSLSALRLEIPSEVADHHERIVRSALAALERERDEAVAASKTLSETNRALQRSAIANRDGRWRAEMALRKIAGEDPNGFDGIHFVGDEQERDSCPGCIARSALASVRDEQAEGEAGSSAAASAVGERQGRQPASPSVEQAGSAPATPEAREEEQT